LLSAVFAALVALGHVTPATLLLFMFLIGVGGALSAPAWQSVVPQLVPAQDLAPAVAANSVGINISRAIGPALAGSIIGLAGIAAPFWVNALSNLGVIGALLWWRAPRGDASRLPAEGFVSAMQTGFRHARHNPSPARHADTRGGVFSFRQRLLGTAAAGGAQPDLPAEPACTEFCSVPSVPGRSPAPSCCRG
jgi:MFS family permease